MNTETEALLATLRGDDEAAERLVRSLTAQQRQTLMRTVDRLTGVIVRLQTELDGRGHEPGCVGLHTVSACMCWCHAS